MIFQGNAITVTTDDTGHVATMVFDLKDASANRFNRLTVSELKEAVEALDKEESIKGLVVKSAKDKFSVGADVTEFAEFAQWPQAQLLDRLREVNSIFSAIEDLPFPTVAAINGVAVGGGLEFCISCDYRVMSDKARIGFPEVNLGIIPGWGGTVRAPRLVGADNAMEWIAGGRQYKADKALAIGMVDAVVPDEHLDAAALDLLEQLIDGHFDYQARRKDKTGPLHLDEIESTMAFMTGKAMVAAQSPKGMVAPVKAVSTMERHARMGRDDALEVEHLAVAELAQGDVSPNLVAIFLNDQSLIKKAKGLAANCSGVERAAVLGAGIMGGGIAYQSAISGVPIVMKDIDTAGLDAGLAEASKLLSKRVNRGRMTAEKMAATLARINPTLHYAELEGADCIVEAIVENEAVKKSVLAEVEKLVSEDAIIASNTSTIPITTLANALKRPENFCGMHFFNPVHRMPLVEIIRGEKTGDGAVAKVLAYALAMGKKPVVVNDCPGFLVNRILFGYFAGFLQLLHEGVDFRAIDRAAEKFGWPMGPAYLADVVGIDTAVHASGVMARGFPSRMSYPFKNGMEVMLESNRLGQKNGAGFYRYEPGKKGYPEKHFDENVLDILAPHVGKPADVPEEKIVNRLMVPLCLESVRCLEEGIAASAEEIDLALVYGIGFPPFRGGVFRHMESMGLSNFVATAESLSHLGELYQPTAKLKELAATGRSLLAH